MTRLRAARDFIDELGPAQGLAAGVGLGLGGGLALLWHGRWEGFVAAGLCLSGTAVVGMTAQPRADVGVVPGLLTLREPLEMIELAGGTFVMGDEYAAPAHHVTVSPFAMAKNLITRELYRDVMEQPAAESEGDDLPVNEVNWMDAVTFCNQLSDRVGLRPCYRIQGKKVEWDRTAEGYRLPTEAEWEYAARGGTRTAYSFGDDPALLGEYAWYTENSEGQLHRVGTKAPSLFGLHDMHGNLWEWCWDWFDKYAPEPITDPVGPAIGAARVLRGGSFDDEPRFRRSAVRFWGPPVYRFRDFGFRCVRGSRRQP